MKNGYIKTLLQHSGFALAIFFAGLICAVMIFGISPERDYLVMLIAAPVSAALIGLVSWSALTVLGKRVEIWKGIVSGILSGSVSHFLTWYVSIVGAYLQNTVSSLGEHTVDPIEGIWASLVLTLFSLAVVGWITIPIGAIVGGIFAALSKRFLADSLK